MRGRVRLETSRRTSRLAAIGLLAFALASLAAAYLTQNVFNKLVLGFCALFFGGVFLLGLRTFWHNGNVPLVTVTDLGVELPEVGLIRWDEIEKVAITRVVGQAALGIWTVDPFLSARRGPPWAWPFAVFNRFMRYPPISFFASVAPIAELYAAIETRRTPTSTPAVSERSGVVSTSADPVHFE
jgi:hypothetical protein